jgi:hypothetical protein
VGAVSGANGQPDNLIAGKATSRVSPDGRYLLFESSVNVTGYESGGASEAYLYDADTGATVCASCRPDGRPSVAKTGISDRVLSPGGEPDQPLYAPRSLVMRNGDPLVFFRAPDALAPGALQGGNPSREAEGAGGGQRENLYEWAHGQLYLISSEPERGEQPRFFGASEEGTDIYFSDGAALTWEDPQGRLAAWDARAGGGFVEPAPSAAGCDPVDEGSCEGAVSPLSSPPVGSASFSGPGNPLLTVPSVLVSPAKPKNTGKPTGKKGKKGKPKHKKKAGPKGKKRKVKGKGRGKGAARKANGNGRAAR